MSWFKSIKANSQLAATIAVWLQKAYMPGGVDAQTVHQDIDQIVGMGIDDANSLGQAITNGEMIYRRRTNHDGELLPAQIDLLNQVWSRLQDATAIQTTNIPDQTLTPDISTTENV